jgi:hypothetical protein
VKQWNEEFEKERRRDLLKKNNLVAWERGARILSVRLRLEHQGTPYGRRR